MADFVAGYWKQPHHVDQWTTYGPLDDFETTFGVSGPEGPATLVQSLDPKRAKAAGASNNLAALWRHATAALLNAAHPNINYRYTVAQVKQMVQDAYASGDYLTTKDLFQVENELEADINTGGGTTEFSMTLFHPLLVKNVPPTLQMTGDSQAAIQMPYMVSLFSADPGDDTITHWTIDWGDGLVETVNGNPTSATHMYDDVGTFTISATATDEDGTWDANTLDVTVLGLRLVEDSNFTVEWQSTLTIPQDPSAISLRFYDLDFDTTDPIDINDAFELALVDAQGNPLVPTITQGRDAYFNITEGEVPRLGAGTNYGDATGTVTVDISHLAPGTQATLIARLVNDDHDTTTGVSLIPLVRFVNSSFNTAPSTAVPFGYVSRPGPVDFAHLTDVTPSISVDYGRTSFSDSSETLYAGMSVTNSGAFALSGPLLVAVKNITAPTVTAVGYDGVTPDGLPYFDLSHLVFPDGGSTFDPGSTTGGFDLTFRNPDNVQFDHELVFLAHINQAPVFVSTPVLDVTAGQTYYELVGDTHGASIDPATGVMHWAPSTNGDYEFTARVTDGRGGEDTQTWTVTVGDVPAGNNAPAITPTPDVDAEIGQALALQVDASDADGDPLFYQLLDAGAGGTEVPAGMTIDRQTGAISWTPALVDVGTHTITVGVIDGLGGQAQDQFDITVAAPSLSRNSQPNISSTPPQMAVAGEVYRYDVVAGDVDYDPLTFSLPTKPDGMAIDEATGILIWQPDSSDVGAHQVLVRVDDGQGGAAYQQYELEVVNSNDPPTITSSPLGPASVGLAWTYQVVANDPNGDALKYRLDQASVDRGLTASTDGLVSWIPSATGDFHVEITVKDQRGGIAVQSFTLPVRNNAPPTITSIPTGPALVDAQYQYQLVADDPDGDPATFTIDEASKARDAAGRARLTLTEAHLATLTFAATATDVNGNVGNAPDITVTVINPADSNPPTALVSSPGDHAHVTHPVDILGTVTDDLAGVNWTLEATPLDGGDTKLIASGSGDVNNAFLGRFDPTLLRNGTYEITLTAADQGNNTTTSSLQIQVTGRTILRTYDDTDNQLTETLVIGAIDSLGNSETNDLTTTYVYNSAGDRIQTIDPRGQSTRTTYNDFGQPTAATDPLGNVSQNFFDSRALLSSTQDPLGNAASLGYDDKANLTTVNDDSGNRLVTNSYSPFGDVTASIPAAGRETHFAYDLNGNQIASWYFDGTGATQVQVLSLTDYDDAGLTTENTYDLRGQLVQTRRESLDESGNPQYLLTRTAYDAAGRVIAQTDQYVEGTQAPIDGNITTYDDAGRVTASAQVTGLVIDLIGSANLIQARLTSPGTAVTSTATEFDTSGRVIESTDSYGLHTYTVYNSFGDVVETRRQAYDENNQLVELTSRTVYDDYGRVSVSTDQYLPGQTVYATQTIYDSLGRATKTIRLKGVNVHLAADGETSITNGGTQLYTTQTIYDSQGRVSQSIAADGQTTTYEYDSLGRQVATLSTPQTPASAGLAGDPNAAGAISVQLRTETEYDSLGRAFKTTTNIRQYTYAGGSTLKDTSVVQTTSNEYDEQGRVKKTTFADGTSISSTYDELGRKTSDTNQLGQVRSYAYDQSGQLTTVTLPDLDGDPQTTDDIATYTYAYDTQGNQTLLVDPLGHETRWTFDDQGRILSRTLPLGFGPDGVQGTGDDNNLPEGDWTESFAYDDRGRQVLAVSFEGAVTQFIYDDTHGGRLSVKKFFDNLAQYNGGQGTPAETESYSYDSFGRVVQIVNSQGTTSYTYDDQGQLAQVASPQGTISYTYDDLGRKTSTIIGTVATPQRVTSYTYDSLGRLATLTDDLDATSGTDAPLVTSYSYDLAGNLARQDDPNGVITTFEYDSLNRLTKLTSYQPDPTPADLTNNNKLTEYAYSLNTLGQRTGVAENFYDSAGAVAFSDLIGWTYDAMGRLTKEELDSSNNALDQTTTYQYDLTGNRTRKETDLGNDQTVDLWTNYVYDANDRLSEEDSSDGNTTTYGYDHTQQTSKSVSSESSVLSVLSVVNFSYDLQGRMNVVETSSYTGGVPSRVDRVTYAYNPDGIRASSKLEVDANADGTFESSTTTQFLIDGHNFTGYQQAIRETVTDDATQTVTRQTDYTYGLDEIAQTVSEGGNTRTDIFGHDGHASVRVLTDLAGALVQFFTYDAYGQLLAIFNSQAQLVSGGNGQLADATLAQTSVLYSGEFFDSTINQQYLRARWYDTATGRFNRLDPFFGDLNDPQSFHKYLFTQGDPLNNADPTGLESLSAQLGALGARGILIGIAVRGLVGAGVGAGIGAATSAYLHLVTYQSFDGIGTAAW